MKRSFGKVYLFSLAVILAVPLVFFPHPLLAREYTFTTIDVPGAPLNWGAYGINDAGDIVGIYGDPIRYFRGYLYSGGNFTPLDLFPQTHAYGINNSGSIVGYGVGPWYHNFLYSEGIFTTIDVPGATLNWGAKGINDLGDIVGSYGTSTERPGFLYSGEIFTPINVPGAVDGCWTVPLGINNSGTIVGTYNLPDNPGKHRGFLYVGGNFTPIDGPGAVGGTDVCGINDFGEIVGTYYDDAGYHPFLYSGGIFTPINVPGALYAGAYGINNSGTIVGYYVDATQRRHGFQASLAPGPVSIDIKPGSIPNSINLESKGKIPLAILSKEDFDAPNQVDQDSLTFGSTGNEPSLAFCNPKGEDVNGDGLKDLVCHFYTEDTEFICSDAEGVLKGTTTDGTPIEGRDSVRIVPCKN